MYLKDGKTASVMYLGFKVDELIEKIVVALPNVEIFDSHYGSPDFLKL